MQDKFGRTYAKLSELKPGDKVEVDTGFDCLEAGKTYEVYLGVDSALFRSSLYINCRVGQHYLEGQLDDEESDDLLGIYKVEA